MSDVLPVDATITIRAETSVADPDTCKFTVSRTVHPGGPFFFHAKELAAGSPLAERLFAFPGVAHVLVAENVVTVGKDSGASWAALKPGIGTVIRAQLVTGVPAILEAPRTRRCVGAHRRRGSCGCSGTLGPASEPFHRGPRRADFHCRREGQKPVCRHEWRVPGMRGLSSDSATRVRGHGAEGRTGDRGHRRHHGPRGGEEAILRADRVEQEASMASMTTPEER
jgi:hypothetical protein